jgi:hypothetical protein
MAILLQILSIHIIGEWGVITLWEYLTLYGTIIKRKVNFYNMLLCKYVSMPQFGMSLSGLIN